MRQLYTEGVPGPFSTYAQGVEVETPARILFGAGQGGVDADGRIGEGITEQTELVWKNIQLVLADAGMAIENLVQINQLLTSRDHRDPAGEVRARILGDHRPASTLLVISGLAHPDWFIEIDFIAVEERR